MVDVKTKRDDAQHVVPLTSTQQKPALWFLDQHLAPVQVIAEGSLALVLNGQLMPGKEGAWKAVLPASLPPLLNPFLLFPAPPWWFPHLQEMTVFWILWEAGHPLEDRKHAPKHTSSLCSNQREEAHADAYFNRHLRLGELGERFSKRGGIPDARILFLAHNEQIRRHEASEREVPTVPPSPCWRTGNNHLRTVSGIIKMRVKALGKNKAWSMKGWHLIVMIIQIAG